MFMKQEDAFPTLTWRGNDKSFARITYWRSRWNRMLTSWILESALGNSALSWLNSWPRSVQKSTSTNVCDKDTHYGELTGCLWAHCPVPQPSVNRQLNDTIFARARCECFQAFQFCRDSSSLWYLRSHRRCDDRTTTKSLEVVAEPLCCRALEALGIEVIDVKFRFLRRRCMLEGSWARHDRAPCHCHSRARWGLTVRSASRIEFCG